MTRRTRSDSTAMAVEAAQAPAASPPSNIELTEEEETFFASIIEEMARVEWTPHAIELAAMLARMMASLNEEQTRLREEETIVTQPSGTVVVNPRTRIVRGLLADIIAMRQSLQIHARAKNGEAHRVAARRDRLKDAEGDSDGLLARPN